MYLYNIYINAERNERESALQPHKTAAASLHGSSSEREPGRQAAALR